MSMYRTRACVLRESESESESEGGTGERVSALLETWALRWRGLRDAPEELENGEDDVVDVAEPARLALLGVVEPAGPVDGDVGRPADELARRHEARAGVLSAVRVHVAEDRAVVADVEPRQDRGKVPHVVGRDAREKVDIVLVVERLELLLGRRPRLEHVHALVQAVAHDEVVGQREAVRLHRVSLLQARAQSQLLLLRVCEVDGEENAPRSGTRRRLAESSTRRAAPSESARRGDEEGQLELRIGSLCVCASP